MTAFLLKYWLHIAIGLAVVCFCWWLRHDGYVDGKAEIQAVLDKHLKANEAATAKFNAETAKKDAAQAEALRQVGFQYEREKAHALDQKDAVIADLRSGALVLRKQWRCPAAGVPEASGSAGIADDAADLQFTAAGDIVRIVGTCEAQVRGLQAVVTADRQ